MSKCSRVYYSKSKSVLLRRARSSPSAIASLWVSIVDFMISLFTIFTHTEEYCYKDENDRQRDKYSWYRTVVALSCMSYESCSAENFRCLM